MIDAPIILSSGALFQLPLRQIFAIGKEALFDGLELIVDDNKQTQNVAILQQLQRKFSLPVYSVHAPIGKSSAFGERADDIVRQSLEFAEAIGAGGLVFHPERQGDQYYERDIVGLLQKYGSATTVKLFLENIPRKTITTKVRPLYDPAYLAQLYTPLCLDTSHLATSGLNIPSVVTAVASHVGHVHFSDSTVTADRHGIVHDEHLPIGWGRLPLAAIVQSLCKAGYRGAYCVELRPTLFQDMSMSEITFLLSELCHSVRQLVQEA